MPISLEASVSLVLVRLERMIRQISKPQKFACLDLVAKNINSRVIQFWAGCAHKHIEKCRIEEAKLQSKAGSLGRTNNHKITPDIET